MKDSNDLSPAAKTALRKIRALRKLPETESTVAAERRIIKYLNLTDVVTVAIALEDGDREAHGEVSRG